MPLFVKLGTLKTDIKDADLSAIDKKFVRWLRDITATGKYIASGGYAGLAVNQSYRSTFLYLIRGCSQA